MFSRAIYLHIQPPRAVWMTRNASFPKPSWDWKDELLVDLLSVFQPGNCGVGKHRQSALSLNVVPPQPPSKPENTRTQQRSHTRVGRGLHWFPVCYWIFRRQMVKAWMAGWTQRTVTHASLRVDASPAVALTGCFAQMNPFRLLSPDLSANQ